MKKTKSKEKSWLDKKLDDKKFKKGFMEEYVKVSIGEQLAALRQKANMTQAAVAKKVGTTASAISRYENAEYDRGHFSLISAAAIGMLFQPSNAHNAASTAPPNDESSMLPILKIGPSEKCFQLPSGDSKKTPNVMKRINAIFKAVSII